MKKILILFFTFLSINFIYSQCTSANPICAQGITPQQSLVGIPSLGSPGCLGSAPNPNWYTFQTGFSGTLIFNLHQGNNPPLYNNTDIDFICWGPFTDAQMATTACNSLADLTAPVNPNNIVACSFSAAAVETITIPNANPGSNYILLITNFSNAPGLFVMDQTNSTSPGAGSTNCSVVCGVDLGPTATSVYPSPPATNTISFCNSAISSQTLHCNFQNPPANPNSLAYQWFLGGVLQPALTTKSITVTQSGTWKVKVTHPDCGTPTEDSVIIYFGTTPVVNPIATQLGPLGDCNPTFDLTALIPALLAPLNPADFTVSFFTDYGNSIIYTDPVTGHILNPSAFQTNVDTTIWVRARNNTSTQCVDSEEISFLLDVRCTNNATAEGNTVCTNNTGQLTFTGPPSAVVTFTQGANTYNVTIPASGPFIWNTPTPLTATTIYTLTNVAVGSPVVNTPLTGTATITVNPNNTVTPASTTPTLCINTALTAAITHITTGATGIASTTTNYGLPAGVTAVWAANTITISGTPTTTLGSPFNYSIPLTGGCGIVNATGTITVTATPTASISGLTQLTQYDVYIYSDCSPTLQSEAALFGTFLTLPFCSNPSAGVMSSDIDSIFASWSWTASGVAYPATGFNLQYGFSGFQLYSPNSTEVAAGGINFADTVVNANLLGGGVYQVYVQAVCGTDTSQFIGPFSVTMPLSNDSVCGAELLTVNGPSYVFNNTGATVQLNEPNIAPTATGAQTTNGWIASTLNGTTWFKFVAPTSGKMRINCTSSNNAWNTYNGQVAVYANAVGCSDFANFTLNSANDNAIGSSSVAPNYTICGLTPGTTYYILFDGSGTAGTYAMKLTSIDLEAGTANPVVSVCAGDSVDLFTAITGNQANGVWTAQLASAASGLNGSTFQSAGLAFQTFNFQYRLTDGCAYDSIIGQVKIFAPSSAGSDGTVTVCRNQPFNLLAGLEGNADMGGQWYNPSNVAIATPSIFSSNIPGQYNYVYITGNNVCPDDSATVLVNVLSSCNWLGLDELSSSSVTLYPNPTTGNLNVQLNAIETINAVVYDAQGKLILTANNLKNGSTIDLSAVETGIYMVHLNAENASMIQRVIKQ